MVKEVLQSIGDVGIFPTLSLLLFLVSFVLIAIWVLAMDKNEVNRISRLPLNDSVEGEEV